MAATHVPRMHKALDRINSEIHHVICCITGLTGLEIVETAESKLRKQPLRNPWLEITGASTCPLSGNV